MSAVPPRWRSNIEVVIPHPTEQQLLICEREGGWTLFHVPIERIWDVETRRISEEVRAELGLGASVQRLLFEQANPETKIATIIYALENHDLAWAPQQGCRWAGAAELGLLSDTIQREVAAAYLAERAAGAEPAELQPWMRAGWLAEASAWVRTQLERNGTPVTGAIEQVKHWGISALLRAHTEGGAFYFKATAVLPLFVNEPLLMAELARRYPQAIPAPLAIDPERRWMLMRDFGAPIGKQGAEAENREMLRRFAALQRSAVADVPDLLSIGVLDRRLDVLPRQLRAILADPAALPLLSAEERAQFEALAPQLEQLCVELAGLGVPQTLVHGDLHLYNVSAGAEQFQFFDWTDACIAHPFLDVTNIFEDAEEGFLTQMRDVYLEGWEGSAPREQLLRAWEIAVVLAYLHQLVSYHGICTGLDPVAGAIFTGDAEGYARKILKALGEPVAA